MAKVHRMPLKVYYADTDAAGVVHHASYLRMLEMARTELLADSGKSVRDLAEKEQLVFAIRKINIQYKSPAKLDDELTIETSIVNCSKVAMDFEQVVYQDTKIICQATINVVVTNLSFKPQPLPDFIRGLSQ